VLLFGIGIWALVWVFLVKEFASFPSSVFLVRSQSPFLGPDLRIADGDPRKLPLSMVTTATFIAVEIVRKNPDQVGFAVNPRRWVVERFFAWIGRNRRPAKDFEAPSAPHAPSSTPHPSCCSCVGSLMLHDFRNRLLACAESLPLNWE
jgi:hypothetical protein